ncbi:MAG: HAD-IIB family hydrolase [Halobacteriota archaeon]
MVPPLALDIDGTLTTPQHTIDPRIFDVLPEWNAPIVIATGKAFPYPVALCHFIGIEERVIAENGGVVYADDEVRFNGDPERARAALEEFTARGGVVGFGEADTTNRWRETERAISIDSDESLLRTVAGEFDLEVIDSGYAYHLKTPGVRKGDGLEAICDILDVDPEAFVAIGDSENDVSLFETAGRSYAVANADRKATKAAETVLEASYFDGTLSVLQSL